MISFDVTVDMAAVELSLERAEAAISGPSLSAFLQNGGVQVLQERAAERFDREGDDINGRWADLKYITRIIRLYTGFPPEHPINRRTGALQNFVVTNQGEHRATGFTAGMSWPTGESGRVAKKYLGAQKGEGTAPPRPVAAANGVDLQLLLSGVAHWIAAASDIEVA